MFHSVTGRQMIWSFSGDLDQHRKNNVAILVKKLFCFVFFFLIAHLPKSKINMNFHMALLFPAELCGGVGLHMFYFSSFILTFPTHFSFP